MQQLGYKPKEFKAWAEAFFYCRKSRGLTITEISRRVGESRRTVQEWEDGISFPQKGNTSVRLYGNMHNLKAYKHLLPKELQDEPEPTDVRQQIASGVNKVPVVGHAVSTVMGAALEKADIVAAEAESLAAEAAEAPRPRPHRFNEAIAQAREDAGFSKRELAALVDVGPTTISNWEGGVSVPIAQHWATLVDLFPGLSIWAPPSKEMDKPGREMGSSGARPVLVPRVDPPVVTAPPRAEPTIADVATAYAIARVKEAAMRTEIAKFETRLLEAQIALDEAKKVAKETTAEAEAAHKRLLEMATR